MKVFKPLLLLALVIIALSFSAFTAPRAHAAVRPVTHVSVGPRNQAYGYYYLTNVSVDGEEDVLEISVDIAPGVDTTITKSWTATNSWGANISIAKSIVTAGLNFDVTASTSWTVSCHADNTSSYYKTLYFDSVFSNYTFNIYYHSYITGKNTYEGAGWAEKAYGYYCPFF